MIARIGLVAVLLALTSVSYAEEFLVRFKTAEQSALNDFVRDNGGKLELVSEEGLLYKWTSEQKAWGASYVGRGNVAYMEPNVSIELFPNPELAEARAQISREDAERALEGERKNYRTDNPAFAQVPIQKSGADPFLKSAWGMFAVGADSAWHNAPQGKEIIVAVTDTGVDYNHADLANNMWHNPGEIPDNGIDDDKNGFVDDIVGWDFAGKDNKPYDLSVSKFRLFFMGGNPGHGTHVAGVVAAQLNNNVGTAGVAPQAKIMALRFLTATGSGSLENAVRCIDYAVNNGAKIINASWGGPSGSKADKALKEAIERAEAKGVIFVAAAGNGRNGKGFDNDNDAKPPVPASFDLPNMVTVSALNKDGTLAKFSNWGAKTVAIGAPGVGIMSTVPGGRYEDTVLHVLWKKVSWNGTSMASPFVAGTLAVIWSTDPKQDYKTVRDRMVKTSIAIPALSGKSQTGGRIELKDIR